MGESRSSDNIEAEMVVSILSMNPNSSYGSCNKYGRHLSFVCPAFLLSPQANLKDGATSNEKFQRASLVQAFPGGSSEGS